MHGNRIGWGTSKFDERSCLRTEQREGTYLPISRVACYSQYLWQKEIEGDWEYQYMYGSTARTTGEIGLDASRCERDSTKARERGIVYTYAEELLGLPWKSYGSDDFAQLRRDWPT